MMSGEDGGKVSKVKLWHGKCMPTMPTAGIFGGKVADTSLGPLCTVSTKGAELAEQ